MGIFDIFRNDNGIPDIPEPQPTKTRSTRHFKSPYRTPKSTPEPRDMVRGFKAAESGNLQNDWYAPAVSINGMIKSDLTMMRARCRERVINDDYAKSYVRISVANIVGDKGIRIQSVASDPNGTRDELAVKAIETAWNKWAKYPEYTDITHKDTWKGILEQCVRIYATDGEVFLRMIEGKDAGEFGFSVQVLDSALCDETLSYRLSETHYVEQGIEFNEYGRAVAYYFLTDDGNVKQSPNGKRHIRLDAKNVIHAFQREFANQIRGIPPLAVSIQRMKMLSGFEEAAVTNARAGAAKMGFFIREGEDYDPANAEDDDGELVEELAAGQFSLLPSSVKDIRTFDTRYPDGEIAEFKKAMLRGVAAGIGVSYFDLGQDLESVNLSSARVAINESRELWKSLQQFFIDTIITKVFERWLAQALVRKQINVMGKPLSIINIEKYKAVHWIPRRWSYADPTKDTKSNIDLMDNNVKSLSTVASEIGIDWEAEAEIIARDNEILKKLGLQKIPQKQEQPDVEQQVQDALEDTDSNPPKK